MIFEIFLKVNILTKFLPISVKGILFSRISEFFFYFFCSSS